VDLTFFALVLLCALLGAVALSAALVAGGAQRRIAKRLRRMLGQRHKVVGPAVALRLKRVSSESRLDALFGRIVPGAENLRRQLARTGRRVTIGKYLLLVLAFALAMVFALSWIGLDAVIAWPAGAVIGVLLPRGLVAWLVRRRVGDFLAQLPDAINLMARGLRTGLPIAETIAASAREVAGPVGAEFRRVADEAQLGQPLVDVLWRAAERVDLPEFAFMVVAFSIQQETGGNLAETLDTLTHVLVRRRQMQLKTRALTAEARSSAWIIALLPLVVLALLSLTNRRYVSQLFTTTTGNELLGAATVCIALGVLSLSRLCRFET
jgi:tight adherence protein B